MRERPILFSAPMIRALLAGRKTVTRRLVTNVRVRISRTVTSDPGAALRLQPAVVAKPGTYRATIHAAGAVSIDVGGEMLGVKPGEFDFVCPYAEGSTVLADSGAGGKHWILAPCTGRLWVREAHALEAQEGAEKPPFDDGRPVMRDDDGWVQAHYRATDPMPDLACEHESCDGGPCTRSWRPSIHMPRWACRIELEVVSVRAERLQELTRTEAIAEGARHFPDLAAACQYPDSAPAWSMEDPRASSGCLGSPQMAFAHLWNQLHVDHDWDSNPWVWRVEFRRVEASQRKQVA